MKSKLDQLKMTKKSNWEQKSADYLIRLYKTGKSRYKQVFEDIDTMEKKIKERNLRGKVKERYIVERKDIKRKTQTCLLREA